jgi:hypothetical protein
MHLLTKDIRSSSRGDPAIKPPIAPVHQSKAIDLAVLARRFHHPLPTTPFRALNPLKRGVKGKLHLILQVEMASREQRQELRHIERRVDSTDQLRLDPARVEVEAAVAPANATSTRSLFPRNPLAPPLYVVKSTLGGGLRSHWHASTRALSPA